MSVYAVFLILGTVINMEGPVKYDLHECNERLGISEWRLDLMFKTPSAVEEVRRNYPEYPYLKRKDIHLVCVEVNKPQNK